MPIDIHPNDAQLLDWAEDRLPLAVEAEIDAHLEQCEQCAARLDSLTFSDEALLEQLRRFPAWTELILTNCVAKDVLTETHRNRESLASGAAAVENRRLPLLEFSQRWQRESLLAHGGIGEVWLATDRLFGRKVALKRLRPEVAHLPAVQERFLREAEITARLSHPGTVHVLDAVSAGENSSYVMSLIRGQSLTAAIQHCHRHKLDQSAGEMFSLLHNVVSVARTIAYAHEKGVLHRDLKPDNIVLGRHGQVTVIDWGLAELMPHAAAESPLTSCGGSHSTDDDQTNSNKVEAEVDGGTESVSFDDLAEIMPRMTLPGVRLGTPSYMSPEQARGDVAAIDERTDVYGLAALLYEVLAGRPPFVGHDVEEVLRGVQNDPPLPPRLLNRSIPESLAAICLKGLSKLQSDRQPSAMDFADAVENWLMHESARQQSDETRQALFNLSGDVMMTLDRDLRIVWANAAWKTVLGWEPEDMIGLTPQEFSHPDDIANDPHVVERLLKNREAVVGFERRLRCQSGRFRWFSFAASPVPNEELICAIGRDIEERRQREQRSVRLLDAAPDALVVVDENGVIRHVNQQTLNLFGYPRDELEQQPLDRLIPNEAKRLHRDYLAEFMRQPAFRPMSPEKSLQARRADGSDFNVTISLSAVEMETETLYVSAIRQCD